jgi:hypothetical protein
MQEYKHCVKRERVRVEGKKGRGKKGSDDLVRGKFHQLEIYNSTNHNFAHILGVKSMLFTKEHL